MEVDVFQQRLNSVMNDLLGSKLPDFFSMIITDDIISGVQTRLQQKGELASGEKPSYSTKPTLVGYPSESLQQNYKTMYKKAYETAKKDKQANWATISGHKLVEVPGGYKQIREMGGLQTSHVDFTISNAMLRSVKIKSMTKSGMKIIITYGPNGKEEEAKVKGHNERYGENILEPNKEELTKASKRIQEQIIRFLNAGLFGK